MGRWDLVSIVIDSLLVVAVELLSICMPAVVQDDFDLPDPSVCYVDDRHFVFATAETECCCAFRVRESVRSKMSWDRPSLIKIPFVEKGSCSVACVLLLGDDSF